MSVVLKLTRASCTILGEAWMERKATGDGLRNGSLQLTTAEARDLQREKRTVRWLWRMKGNRDTSREERKVNFRKDALLPPHSDSIRHHIEWKRAGRGSKYLESSYNWTRQGVSEFVSTFRPAALAFAGAAAEGPIHLNI